MADEKITQVTQDVKAYSQQFCQVQKEGDAEEPTQGVVNNLLNLVSSLNWQERQEVYGNLGNGTLESTIRGALGINRAEVSTDIHGAVTGLNFECGNGLGQYHLSDSSAESKHVPPHLRATTGDGTYTAERATTIPATVHLDQSSRLGRTKE